MLKPDGNTSTHCLFRAREEIEKALAWPHPAKQADHLGAAIDWLERARAAAGIGASDPGAEPGGATMRGFASNDRGGAAQHPDRSAPTRRLPTGKSISGLGFGCAGIWAQDHFDGEVATAMLRTAIDMGVNHFDTSPSYGMTTAEQRLGAVLRQRARDELVISTKVGSNVCDGRLVRSFATDAMARSFNDSLERLGTDHVDILYLHGPSRRDLNPATFRYFEALKDAGRIRLSGVNSFDREVLAALIDSPIDVVMLQFNIEDQSCADLIDRLHAAGKTIISGTALARAKFALGTFLPKDRASSWYMARMLRHAPMFLWQGRQLRKRLLAVPQSPAATAIQFVTGHPKILSTLFGTKNPQHLVENIAASRGRLEASQWEGLRRPRAESATWQGRAASA